jgi:hypothetical protein
MWSEGRSREQIPYRQYVEHGMKDAFHTTANKSNVPVIFINDKRLTLRAQRMDGLLSKLFRNVMKFDAIAPGHPFYQSNISVLQAKYSAQSEKVLAIFLSHQGAIRMALDVCQEKNASFAVIMEDDVSFDFLVLWRHDTFDDIIKRAPKDWNLVQLGHTSLVEHPVHGTIPQYISPVKPGFVNGGQYGAFAYMISVLGMKKILGRSIAEVKEVCPYLTADDCLLPFTPSLTLRKYHPLFNSTYVLVPPIFGVNIDFSSTHRSGMEARDSWLAAASGQCVSLFQNSWIFNHERDAN